MTTTVNKDFQPATGSIEGEIPLNELSFEALDEFTKDMRKSAKLLGRQGARYLVDFYYQIQENRKNCDSRVREAQGTGEPSQLLQWTSDVMLAVEKNVKSALGVFAKEYRIGRWLPVGQRPV